MQLKSLFLKNFRIFQSLNISIPQKVMLITGNNAQGKTSLLEAIYYLATFTSFHANIDRQLIRFEAIEIEQGLVVTHIKADFESNHNTRHLEVRLILQQDRTGAMRFSKEILLDTAKKKVSETLGKFNAVLFLPEMTQIIDGAPEQRRRYINVMIAQADSVYVNVLSQYNQVIQQRNALLKTLSEKRASSVIELDIWDERMAKLGSRLIHERIRVIEELGIEAQFIHHELSHAKESLRIFYQPSYDPAAGSSTNGNGFLKGLPVDMVTHRKHITLSDIENGFLKSLQNNRKIDLQRGVSTFGPHRDEIRFFSNEIDLGIFGSRGQIRTSLVSLKFAEAQWLFNKTGQYPVMLMDEVLAELDQERRHDLLNFLQKGDQVFLTTTDLNLFEPGYTNQCQQWHITDGILTIQ